jgi:hypothetical protein
VLNLEASRARVSREPAPYRAIQPAPNGGEHMRIQIAAAGVAGMLAFGLAQMPAASASTTAGPKVGETVFKNGTWHKYEATYLSLPRHIQLIEPFNREVSGLTWDSWTRTGGIANGILMNANGCCGAAAVVQVTRPRNGHFTRMSITTSGAPQKFWWPAVVLKTSRRVWQAS